MSSFADNTTTIAEGPVLHALLASVIHSLEFGTLEKVANAALVFSPQNGAIHALYDLDDTSQREEYASLHVQKELDQRGKLVIPGFVDAHCHAPQYVFTGTGMDLSLLQWLETYTFPSEAKFADLDFARVAYEKSIQRHLRCGTTFASYFATIHNEACQLLVEIIHRLGQRAFVGKVSMDRNSPAFYCEETEKGGEDAEEFVQFVLSQTETGRAFLRQCLEREPEEDESVRNSLLEHYKETRLPAEGEESGSNRSSLSSVSSGTATTNEEEEMRATEALSSNNDNSNGSNHAESEGGKELSKGQPRQHHTVRYEHDYTLLNKPFAPLVLPCVTPRFVPTCTDPLMLRLGEIAARYGLPIQSHMSESVNEIKWVKTLHPECLTYADAYENCGLLNEHAYMAHCCHSTEEEIAVIERAGASVVHCASSNFMLSSGVMDVRHFIERGIKVAIGTDVAGGYSPSMLDALRQTIVASRVKGFEHKDDSAGYRSLSLAEAFHLATVGGAAVLGFGDVLGNFLPGKKLDCLVVDVNVPGSPIDTFPGETFAEHFEKFVFLGDDRNITQVFVDGRQVI